MKTILMLLILLLPGLAFAQVSKDVWKPFRGFIGEWKGTGEGESGKGSYERSYKFVYGEKFIEIRNKAIYPKQEKNPKGEVHEDIGYISYDKIRKTFVLRQFHKEGFVNQFTIENISSDGKTIVFISEAIENIPAGWRAKETYQMPNDDEISESFELAEPKAEFRTYSKVTLKRVKQ